MHSTEFFKACEQKWDYIKDGSQQDAPDFLRDFLNHLNEVLPGSDISQIIFDTFYCGIKTQLQNQCEDCDIECREVMDEVNNSDRQLEWTPILAIRLPLSPNHKEKSINLEDLILPEEEVDHICDVCGKVNVMHINRNTLYHTPKVLVMMCII